MLAFFVIVLPIIGGVAGVVKPNTYHSRMTILIQESARHNPFLEDLAVETRLKDRIKALDALLHSRHVLLGVATDRELINDDMPPREREYILQKLSSKLSLRLIGDELVQLSLQQDQPEEIDALLLSVAQRFMEKVLAPERSSIVGSVKFLETQLEQSSEELRAAEEAYAAFASENADALPELHAGNVRRLAELKLALSERSVELEGARQNVRLFVERLAQSNPVVLRIEQAIVLKKTELATLRARYTEAHSAVQAANRQLARLEDERKNLLSSAPASNAESIEKVFTSALRDAQRDSGFEELLISQIQRLQSGRERIIDLERQVVSLNAEIEKLETLVAGVGRTETELRRVERNLSVKRVVHEKLMERAEMARVTGALGKFEAPERIKVIDQPSIPSQPEGFTPLAFVIAGLFGGFAAGGGVIVLLELLDATVKRRSDLEEMIDAPAIARVQTRDINTNTEEKMSAPWRSLRRFFPSAITAAKDLRARIAEFASTRRVA